MSERGRVILRWSGYVVFGLLTVFWAIGLVNAIKQGGYRFYVSPAYRTGTVFLIWGWTQALRIRQLEKKLAASASGVH